MESEPWYGVRCVFRCGNGMYEERVTVWRAADLGDAIAQAEAEAREYASDLDGEYLGMAQAFHLSTRTLEPGVEVFSLIRESSLPPTDYLDRFFDTGSERQQRK